MHLRCYAEGRKGQWEAVCLDFDLAVQGETFEEVHAELVQAIRGYLEYVQTLPERERAQFMRRRAPLAMRVKFLLFAVFSLFNHWWDRGPDRAEFTIACPA